MNKSVAILLLALSCLTACVTTQSFPSDAKNTEGPPLPEAIVQQKTAWTETLNNGTAEGLETFYWNSAGLLWGRNYFRNATAVATQWNNWQPGLGKLVEQATSAVVQHDDSHYFEMGYYKFSVKDPTIYAYATAWTLVNDRWLRELEIVQPLFEQQEVQIREIDRARELWEKQSNAHDHKVLVGKSYASDGYYVNQGQVYRGTQAISEKYSYMSRPDWQIDLTAKAVMKVQNELAYELGEYKSGGTGHYLIVWEKQGPVWRVLLDFNF